MDKIKQVFSHDKSDSTAAHGSHASQATSATNNSTRNPLSNTATTGATTGSTTQHSGEHVLERAAPPAQAHPHSKGETHLNETDAAQASHDHKHLAAVTHERHHVHETEEVQRQREVERHIHHVQHHVQPVLDEQHAPEQHHEKVHAVSQIQEKHVNTDEDKALFAGLNKHHDQYQEAGKERVVVDKGEIVHESKQHHVHHVVQPVIERDTHEHHTIHTVIPTHQTTHEAPIVHQSVEHEPMHLKDFVAGGGDLKSKLTHDKAGVLSEGDCERSVDGPLEQIASKLHLGGASHTGSTTTGATTTGSTAPRV